ncbi:hypothetical protein [Phyllobacterium leguminum]|uniref:Phage gp6-like head-tail connector protein n=1 Tax=Phyllobacterium leguminum TaxID=314237 RepID=A0A318SZQ7_9HYPH|nr:hypothetical protein [Phyllobacterium leguminum]PYE86906.1 hypothetical protein C7477_11844 [Phyllobacterium leguminum]
MALIDRVKERTGSSLSDTELQAMIDAIIAEIDARFGPTGETTILLGESPDLPRYRHMLRLTRPMDESKPVTIVEIDPGWSGTSTSETVLAADDYRLMHGGRTLQRLWDGTNGHRYWASLVRITYTPIGALAMRDEAVIRLMAIDVGNPGALKSEHAGDYSWTAASGQELSQAREDVFTWLGGVLGAGTMTMA